MADDVPGEKSLPSFTQPRPASNITDSGKNQASYGKPPSYSDLRTQPVSDKEHDRMADEKPPTHGDVRPLNPSSHDEASFDEKNPRPHSYRE
ncbi:hypothetical protein Tco_1053779 [Tanacetum coccineum]|uniref:Uncharacterized protein n=1 Tax=Tanacetum coccineum TaxID=301880 RepID=A0ABQ5GWR7_9ASTR